MLEQFFTSLLANGKDAALFTIVLAQLYVIVRLALGAIGRTSTDERTANAITMTAESMRQACNQQLEVVGMLGELLGRKRAKARKVARATKDTKEVEVAQ